MKHNYLNVKWLNRNIYVSLSRNSDFLHELRTIMDVKPWYQSDFYLHFGLQCTLPYRKQRFSKLDVASFSLEQERKLLLNLEKKSLKKNY